MDMNGTIAVEPWDQPRRCVLCHRIVSSEIESDGEVETTSICGDCKFLFLEDSHIQHTTRQTRYNNTRSESSENIQFRESEHGNQSRRWRRVLSDTESDGFDSDVSVQVDTHPDDASLNQSNSDDDEFEEVENTVGSLVGRVQLHRSLATNGRNLPADWLNEILSPEAENLERSRYVGNAGDYLDARGFEQLLERLAETDGSRWGAPPAAASFVKSLEQVVVGDDDGDLVCVICKDSVCVGSVMNRLPCLHVYHPSCIMAWLNARNTCPLCRYELPTDDKECERRRRRSRSERQYASSGGGGRWWVVAVPLASMVAIGVVVWLGGGVDRSRRWCVL
ncbi:hypothetical protein OSB04_022983 [Centaurea solstitialis]|uniref:RING-type E3 ubiquitin transferase n=1 Tax=Centaurea solstitialis TaxID=347529 RepID=A0AA38WCG1_9ASTR|nr:hypothetical protein OSB04_022983 [Centaurea solstitialis]